MTIFRDRAALSALRTVLTPRQYDVYVLTHRDGLGTRPIGRLLNLSPATVREHLTAAEKKAREIARQP